MMEKRVQAKHIPDAAVLEVIDRVARKERRWTHTWDLDEALDFPPKVILAKAASMIRRGVITGCSCGCRGDFERAPARQ
jgi:hypothetical protein